MWGLSLVLVVLAVLVVFSGAGIGLFFVLLLCALLFLAE